MEAYYIANKVFGYAKQGVWWEEKRMENWIKDPQ